MTPFLLSRRFADFFAHLVLIVGILIVAVPIYVAFVASTLESDDILAAPMSLVPGPYLVRNYWRALTEGFPLLSGRTVGHLMMNSLIVALSIAVGKIVISFLSAFAVVFFRFRGRMVAFWAIFLTLMLPVEVRIVPTYQIVANVGLIDTYGGLTLPLLASATATLLFRQFFLTIPGELVEAARMDGAGPLRFMRDILLPLSRTNIAALFVIMFVYGWNQYLWPLLIVNSPSLSVVVVGIRSLIGGGESKTAWELVMATAILAMVPPMAVVVLMQRWFVKGLVESEK